MTRADIIESMGWMPSADNGMSDIIDRIERTVNQAVEAEREAILAVIEAYKVPVGNSAAGEMACEWTMDALRDLHDAIRARGSK
jgi:hypothetical protein